MSDDLEQKLAVIREQTRQRQALQEDRHAERKQEIMLQNSLRQSANETSLEALQLKHELDPEIRERDKADAIFYKNIDLIEFIKAQQVKQNHLLEEIHHTTLSSILEKAILMILSARLDDQKRHSSHAQEKDKQTHQTNEQMRLEQFRADLNHRFGEQTTEEIMKMINQHQDEWEQGSQ